MKNKPLTTPEDSFNRSLKETLTAISEIEHRVESLDATFASMKTCLNVLRTQVNRIQYAYDDLMDQKTNLKKGIDKK